MEDGGRSFSVTWWGGVNPVGRRGEQERKGKASSEVESGGR